jgi:hypothetical protein
MIEQIPAGTNDPVVLECSWLPKRELMGRGRINDPGHWTEWAIMPSGGVYIDGGTLDLGVVRDSTLISTNDFQVFGENFFNNTTETT